MNLLYGAGRVDHRHTIRRSAGHLPVSLYRTKKKGVRLLFQPVLFSLGGPLHGLPGIDVQIKGEIGHISGHSDGVDGRNGIIDRRAHV